MDESDKKNADEVTAAGKRGIQDGSIDFARYSNAQLEELCESIDSQRFPVNFANLQEELAKRRITDAKPPVHTKAVRYTPHDGLSGWFESKARRFDLYGAGTAEVRVDEIVLQGRQRTWLGVGHLAEVPLQTRWIRNVLLLEQSVQFEYKRPWRRRRRYEIQFRNAVDAVAFAKSLPTAATASFARDAADLRHYHLQVRSSGRRPWVTQSLVLFNLAVFIAMIATGGSWFGFDAPRITAWGSNFGPLTLGGQWWRLASALFLHANWLHLVLNMWALWNVGRLAERLYGNFAFALLYAATGLIAGLASLAWNPAVNSLGASGAIFGVFGVFLAYLMKRQTRIPAAVFRAHWLPTLLFVLLNLASGMQQPNIDNAAHVGGLLSGFAFGWMLARPLGEACDKSRLLLRLAFPVVIGCLAALGLSWQLRGVGPRMSEPDAFSQSHAWFVAGEADNTRNWMQLAQRAAAGTISDKELGEAFGRDILPFWKSSSTRLAEENGTLHPSAFSYPATVAEYARLRMEWAQALVDSTIGGKPDRAQDAVKRMEEVDRAMARIERLALRGSTLHAPLGIAHSTWVNQLRNLFSISGESCVHAPAVYGHQLAATDSRTDSPALADAVACRAQRLYLRGRYKELDADLVRYAAKLGDLPNGGSRIASLWSGLDELLDYGEQTVDQTERRIGEWRREVPGSIYPDLFEAAMFFNWAWSARGHDTANAVNRQAWVLFAHRLEMTSAGLLEIADRASGNPLWYQLSMALSHSRSDGTERVRALFDQGVERFPDYLPLYQRMLNNLMPRWQGSYEKVDQFINEMSARRRDVRSATQLYAKLYWIYDDLEQDDANIFTDASAQWDAVKRGVQTQMDDNPSSDYLVNRFARLACKAGDEQTFRSVRPSLDTRYSASVWSNRVTLATCDEKFRNSAVK